MMKKESAEEVLTVHHRIPAAGTDTPDYRKPVDGSQVVGRGLPLEQRYQDAQDNPKAN